MFIVTYYIPLGWAYVSGGLAVMMFFFLFFFNPGSLSQSSILYIGNISLG